jgi:hypothetical protein
MKKIKLTLIAIASLFVFISCEEKEFNDTEQNRFVVKEIKERKGLSKMTSYKVLMLDASGLGETVFWVVDSVGKYNIGDRLILQPCK